MQHSCSKNTPHVLSYTPHSLAQAQSLQEIQNFRKVYMKTSEITISFGNFHNSYGHDGNLAGFWPKGTLNLDAQVFAAAIIGEEEVTRMAMSGIQRSGSQTGGLDALVGKEEEKAGRSIYQGAKALAAGALYKSMVYAPAVSRVAELCAAVVSLYLR